VERSPWAVLGVVVPLSLFSIGGAQSIVAELQRQVVSVHGWMSAQEFTEAFAISRMSPGPGSMFITLVGWHVAGVAGAVAASAGIYAPSCALTYFVASVWSRFEHADWRKRIEAGLRPVAAGLLLAGVFALLTSLAGAPWAQIIAVAATAVLTIKRIHPLLLLGAGALLFLLGHALGAL
jgi:chromate transporter